MSSEEYFNGNGKFLNMVVPISFIEITDATYFSNKQYGTTYSIGFKINRGDIVVNGEPLNRYRFLCKVSTKSSQEALANYGKATSDTIGMLADFLGIARTVFRQTIKKPFDDVHSASDSKVVSPAVAAKLQELVHADDTRLIKIDATLIPPDGKFQNLLYKVFNIATEKHVTVPFGEVRVVVKDIINLPISVVDDASDIRDTQIAEYRFAGQLVWEYATSVSRIEDEELFSRLRIMSGDNTKDSAMKVIGYIKVGKCQNTIRCAIYDRIIHVGDWETRLRTSITECQTALITAENSIKMAMTTALDEQAGKDFINGLTFGLSDEKKIEALRVIIVRRFEYEYSNSQNVWALSQSLTYVGSHPDEYQTEITENKLSESAVERLSDYGFQAITQMVGNPSNQEVMDAELVDVLPSKEDLEVEYQLCRGKIRELLKMEWAYTFPEKFIRTLLEDSSSKADMVRIVDDLRYDMSTLFKKLHEILKMINQ